MTLLEREREIALLNQLLDAARTGSGSMVLISGEAGIGKSAVDRRDARRSRTTPHRIDTLPVLIVVTMRDDEPAHHVGLRRFLGDLARVPGYRRLTPAPLSTGAVQSLVGDRSISASALHRRTGGNPFFLIEVLAAESDLPGSVSDAILGRLSRLDPDVQRIVLIAATLFDEPSPERI